MAKASIADSKEVVRICTVYAQNGMFNIFIALFCFTRSAGKKTGNATVLALAYDHRNDIVCAAGAAIGIFLGRAGYGWADPLAGALVALVVLGTGIQILRDSSADLMDTVPDRRGCGSGPGREGRGGDPRPSLWPVSGRECDHRDRWGA